MTWIDALRAAFNSGLPKTDYEQRSWPEDFPHENGNYTCKCCHCGEEFLGHKRRVTCKLCANGSA